MQLSSGSAANRAMPHQLRPFQGSGCFESPDSRLGVRPVKSAAIDMVVWWKEAIAFENTCPSSARRCRFGVAAADP
jgi:hypothetical protein